MDGFSESIDVVGAALARGIARERPDQHGAAVLIPLVPGKDGPEVLFELRSFELDIQPGEVCLPGGHIEAGETPREAVVREVCEELLVSADAVEIISELGKLPGPRELSLWVFVGTVRGYAGTYDPTEVDHTFTIPLAWFMKNAPEVFRGEMSFDPPADLPWDRIPGGRDYPWSVQHWEVPFYLDTDPLVWGITARIIMRFIEVLKAGGLALADLR